jgi:hypothetical protein
MSKKIVGSAALFVALVVALGFVVAQTNVPEASAKDKNQFQMDLLIDMTKLVTIETGETGRKEEARKVRASISGAVDLVEEALARGDYNVDSFFDVFYVSNIGSSGEDGVSFKSSPTFDVFFEVDYKTSRGSGFATEMVSMSLTASPGGASGPQGAIDIVKAALQNAGGDVYVGHVTVLK